MAEEIINMIRCISVIEKVIFKLFKDRFKVIKTKDIVIKVSKEKDFDFIILIKKIPVFHSKLHLYWKDFVLRQKIYQHLFSNSKYDSNFIYIKLSEFGIDFFLTNILSNLQQHFDRIWSENKKININIEYGSVNPVGEIHLGNFRNICIGMLWSKFYKFLGYKVENSYLVSDIGSQVKKLAQSIILNEFKNEYTDSFSFLKKAHPDIFKIKDSTKLCKKFTKIFLSKHKKFLKENGAFINTFYYESNIDTQSFLKFLLNTKYSKLIQNKDNSTQILCDVEKYEVIIKSNGESTYFFRDLTNLYKISKEFNNIFIIVGFDHQLYINKMLKTLSFLDINNITFILHQYVNLKNTKISKRSNMFKIECNALEYTFWKKVFYFYPSNKHINISVNVDSFKRNFNGLYRSILLDRSKQVVLLDLFLKNIKEVEEKKRIYLFYWNFISLYSLLWHYQVEYKFIKKFFSLLNV